MFDVMEMYRQKCVSAAEAVRLVKDGDWVDYGQTCSFPQALDEALALRKEELRDVKIRSAISMLPVQVVERDPAHEAFSFNVWHASALDRHYIDKGLAWFSPMLFRYNGSYYAQGFAPVDVAMVTVSSMDRHGNFSFGLSNCSMQEMLGAAKHIILEVNPNMPRVFGTEGDHIHISEADYIVENDVPLPTPHSPAATETDRRIAANIFPPTL